MSKARKMVVNINPVQEASFAEEILAMGNEKFAFADSAGKLHGALRMSLWLLAHPEALEYAATFNSTEAIDPFDFSGDWTIDAVRQRDLLKSNAADFFTVEIVRPLEQFGYTREISLVEQATAGMEHVVRLASLPTAALEKLIPPPTVKAKVDAPPTKPTARPRAGTNPAKWMYDSNKGKFLRYMKGKTATVRKVIATSASKQGCGSEGSVARALVELNAAGWLTVGTDGACLSTKGEKLAEKWCQRNKAAGAT